MFQNNRRHSYPSISQYSSGSRPTCSQEFYQVLHTYLLGWKYSPQNNFCYPPKEIPGYQNLAPDEKRELQNRVTKIYMELKKPLFIGMRKWLLEVADAFHNVLCWYLQNMGYLFKPIEDVPGFYHLNPVAQIELYRRLQNIYKELLPPQQPSGEPVRPLVRDMTYIGTMSIWIGKFGDGLTGMTEEKLDNEIHGKIIRKIGQEKFNTLNEDERTNLFDEEKDLRLSNIGAYRTPGQGIMPFLDISALDALLHANAPENRQFRKAIRRHQARILKEDGLQFPLTWLRTVQVSNSVVFCVAITPDNTRIVTGCRCGSLKVLDLKTGAILYDLIGHDDFILCLKITPDGKYVVTGGRDRTARVWDLATGTCCYVLSGHRSGVWQIAIAPNSGRCITAESLDKRVKVWDLGTGTCIATIENRDAWSLTISPSSTYAFIGSLSQLYAFEVYRSEPERGMSLVDMGRHHSSYIMDVAMSTDGEYLVTGGNDGIANVWSFSTRKGLAVSRVIPLSGHTKRVERVAITPDNTRVVTVSEDGTAKVWRLSDGTLLHDLTGHTDRIWNLVITSDNKYLVTGSEDGTAKVWDLSDGRCMSTLEGNSPVRCVAITRKSAHIVTTHNDGTVKIWGHPLFERLRGDILLD